MTSTPRTHQSSGREVTARRSVLVGLRVRGRCLEENKTMLNGVERADGARVAVDADEGGGEGFGGDGADVLVVDEEGQPAGAGGEEEAHVPGAAVGEAFQQEVFEVFQRGVALALRKTGLHGVHEGVRHLGGADAHGHFQHEALVFREALVHAHAVDFYGSLLPHAQRPQLAHPLRARRKVEPRAPLDDRRRTTYRRREEQQPHKKLHLQCVVLLLFTTMRL
eukprot:CAMPEP_0198665654 /NCGR_PEP_ID=MMETSP1467-20131203/61355_1 /TAXON_ID=1462469 /ORGANISM="unid. sp., Strain CCMP2135" /LENGTH=221 /DNA_ID=CAMNT_0044402257 /DNA_START=52 /DNA_END=715 /DNA_ORIENTATION=+